MNSQYITTVIGIAEKANMNPVDQDPKKAAVQSEVYQDGLKLRREARKFKEEFSKMNPDQKVQLSFDILAAFEQKFGAKEG